MNWNRIVLKLGGSILLLFLVILFPLGFVLHQIYSGLYYSNVKEEIDQLSSRYANALTSVHDREILSMFVTLAGFTNTEVYIVNREGTIVIDSGIPGIVAGERMKENELDQLKNGESIEKEYQFLPATERFLVSGKPIYNDRQFEGGIFVLSSIDNIDRSMAQVTRLVTVAGIGAFLLAIGFTLILSRKLSAPLLEMQEATRKIAKGDLKTRVSVLSGDEVGQLASAINDLAVELERYRVNRQEFFANISHELRTPISYLEGYANVLMHELYDTEEEKKQYLSIICDESKRLIRLLNDLFDLAKAEEGHLDLEMEPLDVIEIMNAVIVKVEFMAHAKGLTIEKDFDKSVQPIIGDRQRMEQIFINLLENAIRYTESGKILVKVQNGNDGQVKVAMADTGIGIPEDELPLIFERFHRVEKSRSKDHGGTGLGLSIVKKLVELQGGTIRVSSKLREGTTFEITFPVHKNDKGLLI